ncbi:uncharacterized protein PHALS_14310 [Plasmopara halstedii]|uniref:Uncharacterized protein n=1 Tax=Plasmopara halstedii TaxID=4781 RepID=A0A0P1ATI1_PLAHL|nr:uncharacterized protein PHALS_14310 [Plasmopara halstedii]CEG44040.1 hypothetical protein PHALS_14310 [Plasmopara halstedii]|eukprot:XP_024580409.1 hypothetical protein PHALS_14310 [Plasmopara halstedii]
MSHYKTFHEKLYYYDTIHMAKVVAAHALTYKQARHAELCSPHLLRSICGHKTLVGCQTTFCRKIDTEMSTRTDAKGQRESLYFNEKRLPYIIYRRGSHRQELGFALSL